MADHRPTPLPWQPLTLFMALLLAVAAVPAPTTFTVRPTAPAPTTAADGSGPSRLSVGDATPTRHGSGGPATAYTVPVRLTGSPGRPADRLVATVSGDDWDTWRLARVAPTGDGWAVTFSVRTPSEPLWLCAEAFDADGGRLARIDSQRILG